MKVSFDIPGSTAMLLAIALYWDGDDLRLTSAGITDPWDGERVELDGVEVVEQ